MTPIPCSGLLSALKSAAAGAVIAVTGTCPPLTINGVHVQGVTIDATAATFPLAAERIYSSSGITWKGGSFLNAPGNAVIVENSSQITVEDALFVGPGNSGVTVFFSDHVDILHNVVKQSRGDGFDTAASGFVRVLWNGCEDNVPTQTHPDCWQGWGAANRPLTDTEVAYNTVIGESQGFDEFDHTFPASQRVKIHDNFALITLPRCVSLLNGTDGDVWKNQCLPYPGARWAPNVDVQGGVNTVAHDNTVAPLP